MLPAKPTLLVPGSGKSHGWVGAPGVGRLALVRILDWFGDGTTAVVDLALACCAVETEFAVPAKACEVDAVPVGARVIVVVSGTLTDAVAPLVTSTIRGLGEQAHVVSFGACAAAGGPYWDSYSVTKGIDQLVRVDHYIAGCPPPPSSLADHIASLSGVDGG